jgi:hypothetical protein
MKLSFASSASSTRGARASDTAPSKSDDHAATMRELRAQLAIVTRLAREGARRRSLERERAARSPAPPVPDRESRPPQ